MEFKTKQPKVAKPTTKPTFYKRSDIARATSRLFRDGVISESEYDEYVISTGIHRIGWADQDPDRALLQEIRLFKQAYDEVGEDA